MPRPKAKLAQKSNAHPERDSLSRLGRDIESCEQCPRLREHCLEIARVKRKSFANETYWAKPIAGFGDPQARVHIVGLAPAAHGANRTGRIFTGDRSGQWLYRALHKAGFANQATYERRDDGLKLNDVWISCVARCAPPDNKPLPGEIESCSGYLEREIALLDRVKVVIALGQIALAGIWPSIGSGAPRPKFGHGVTAEIPPRLEGTTGRAVKSRLLILSYHPSQQNTFTGRLTEPMFDHIFELARRSLS